MDDKNWKKLQEKLKEQDFDKQKGRLERFMEKICNNHIIFVEGSLKEVKLILK